MNLKEKFEETNHRKEEIEKEQRELISRSNKAKENILNLEDEKLELKEKRQKMLADNLNVSSINKRFKKIDEEIEINQDTIVGIDAKLKAVKNDVINAYNETTTAYENLLEDKLNKLGDKYFQAGSEFAQVVKEYVTLENLRDINRSSNTKIGYNFKFIPNVKDETKPILDSSHYDIYKENKDTIVKKYDIPNYSNNY